MTGSNAPASYSEEFAPPPSNRRRWLTSLAALVIAPEAATAAESGPGPVAGPGPMSALVELPHPGHWRIDISGEELTATAVPRWEVPAIAAAEQPLPVFTEVSRFGSAMIFRWWQPEQVWACGLCEVCSAELRDRGKHPGYAVCVREGPGSIADEQAPLYRQGDEVPEGVGRWESTCLGPFDDEDEED